MLNFLHLLYWDQYLRVKSVSISSLEQEEVGIKLLFPQPYGYTNQLNLNA